MNKKIILLVASLFFSFLFFGCQKTSFSDNFPKKENSSVPEKKDLSKFSAKIENVSPKAKPTKTTNSLKNKSMSPTSTIAPPQPGSYLGKYKGAILKTNLGEIELTFFEKLAPQTVNNFLYLADNNFYDKTKFHRVIKGFMIQGGDPNSKDDDWSNDGTGGPGYTFKDEFNSKKLVRGSLAMANTSQPNTNGSQFFIVTASATPHLDGKHTNFGKVIRGMEVIDKIEQTKTNAQDHPLKDIVIETIQLIKNK